MRRFGGIVATDNLSLDVVPGELHAIIGPNGAGKTTLISQLTGQLTPNSGTIHFAGRDVTRLPAYRRSRLGLARSFQITSLLPDFTAIDNVALAAQAHDGHSFRFWGNARKEAHLREASLASLRRVALADRITVLVYGRVIASGDPDAIRNNEEVKRAYLGDQHVVVAHG